MMLILDHYLSNLSYLVIVCWTPCLTVFLKYVKGMLGIWQILSSDYFGWMMYKMLIFFITIIFSILPELISCIVEYKVLPGLK